VLHNFELPSRKIYARFLLSVRCALTVTLISTQSRSACLRLECVTRTGGPYGPSLARHPNDNTGFSIGLLLQ
jgi:hypothetical protein